MELEAHKKREILDFRKKHFGRRVSGLKEAFSFVKTRAPSRSIRAPILHLAGRVLIASGTDFGTRGPIFTGLYIEKCVF